MTILEIWSRITEIISEYGSLTFVLFLICMGIIQIVPIKVNPWSKINRLLSKILSSIGSMFMREQNERMERLESTINDLHDELRRDVSELDKIQGLSEIVDENEIDRIRWEILDAAGNCQRDINHTQNWFQHIFKLNTKYHKILERSHKTNGEVDREIAYMEELYAEKQRNNSFLK